MVLCAYKHKVHPARALNRVYSERPSSQGTLRVSEEGVAPALIQTHVDIMARMVEVGDIASALACKTLLFMQRNNAKAIFFSDIWFDDRVGKCFVQEPPHHPQSEITSPHSASSSLPARRMQPASQQYDPARQFYFAMRKDPSRAGGESAASHQHDEPDAPHSQQPNGVLYSLQGISRLSDYDFEQLLEEFKQSLQSTLPSGP